MKHQKGRIQEKWLGMVENIVNGLQTAILKWRDPDSLSL